MPYAYLEDDVTSDVTFRVWGPTIEEVFRGAVDATVNLMIDPVAAVEAVVTRAVALEAESLDLLLAALLDEVVFRKDTEGLLLRVHAIRIETEKGRPRLEAELAGEPPDRRKHTLGVDVKAVTLYGLCVVRRDEMWEARVTVDV
jgi:SHS2 domain-containing protein